MSGGASQVSTGSAGRLGAAVIACLLGVSSCCLRDISGDDRNDAGLDAGPDAGEDAGPDAGEDAGLDAGPDAGDSSPPDSGPLLDAGSCGPASNLTSFVTPATGEFGGSISADLNGDGMLDLVMGFVYPSVDGGGFEVFFGLSDGGLSSPTVYGRNEGPLTVGDVNGDGRPDLVAQSLVSPAIVVFLNDGRGGLLAQDPIPIFSVASGAALGDLNDDGLTDLVVLEGDNREDVCCGGTEILYGQASGGFSTPVELMPFLGDADLTNIVVGDLNGDGLPDIVTDTSNGLNLAVLLNRGDGGFEKTLYTPPASGDILLLPRPGRVPDLLVALSGIGFEVLENSGQGTFPTRSVHSAPGGFGLALGDFNGDCLLDVATTAAYVYGCQDGWEVSVLYGDADGGFGAPQSFTAMGGGPNGLAALGPAADPHALVVADFCGAGFTVYGDASSR